MDLSNASSSHVATVICGATLIFCCVLLLQQRDRRSRLRAAMPPGPQLGWLGFGDNRRDMSGSQPWKTYNLWHEKYGMFNLLLQRLLMPYRSPETWKVPWCRLSLEIQILSVHNFINHKLRILASFPSVLGTVKVATDLLEKRGSVYSSRPRNIIG